MQSQKLSDKKKKVNPRGMIIQRGLDTLAGKVTLSEMFCFLWHRGQFEKRKNLLVEQILISTATARKGAVMSGDTILSYKIKQ